MIPTQSEITHKKLNIMIALWILDKVIMAILIWGI